MRYFFIVQGEGRGHMTQAISLSQMLKSAGHVLVHVVVGKSPSRYLPDFFTENINAPITQVESPNFVTDKQHRSVKPFRTVVYSFWKSKIYRKSIDRIAALVDETQPDVIVNFYDFLGGIYNFFHRPETKFICIAHQYLMSHPEFDFPKRKKIDRASLHIANRITRLGAHKTLALSFQHFDDVPKKRMHVVPPLLRSEVRTLPVEDKGHLLIYMVNPGYSSDVERFHTLHPSIPLVVFWDHQEKPKTVRVDDNLTFNQLDGPRFLETLASSKGLVTTAGFESVCESMWLGKPVMMIPVEGHYEQMCNAIDATKAGAGISSDAFDISEFVDYLSDHTDISHAFRGWVDRGEKLFLQHIC